VTLSPCPAGIDTTSGAGYQVLLSGGAMNRSLRQGGLGMSYEIADAVVEDIKAKVWVLSRVTFTGAAVLRRDKAAYQATWIELE
jgi:hypothetical protein